MYTNKSQIIKHKLDIKSFIENLIKQSHTSYDQTVNQTRIVSGVYSVKLIEEVIDKTLKMANIEDSSKKMIE